MTCPEAPSDRYLWLDLQKDPNLGAEGLEEMYDHWTIGEYIEQRIYPLINELKNLEKVGDSLRMRKV